jgi:bacteriocin-type transport-associated protein
MTEVLLKELSNSDIDWMLATGTKKEVAPDTVLVRQGQPVDCLYLVLDGALSVTIASADANPLGKAFAALEGGQMSGREIATLSSGEMVGEIPFLENHLPSTTVKAIQNSQILAISQKQLKKKLQKDLSFAAHLYRASAILLADRLEKIFDRIGYSTVVLNQPQLREVLFVFSELRDNDIDWLITAGSVEKIKAGTILLHGGRPIEALYLILDGQLAITVSEDERSPLSRAFSSLEGSETPEKELSRLSRGDIVGESPFLEARPPNFNVKAIDDAIVLSVPRWRLAAKLLHDVGFASRFYRVLAALLADKEQAIVNQIGYGRVKYSQGQPLEERDEYDNELSADALSRVALAGARFDWMLKRMKVVDE